MRRIKSEEIRVLIAEGLGDEEIAKRLECSVPWVKRIRKDGPKRKTVARAQTERKEANKARFLVALAECKGVMSDASRRIGISCDRPYGWLREDPDFKAKVDDIREISIDFAESALFRQIEKDIPASTIFFLKTRAKHRGYVERTEVTGTDGNALEVRVIKPSLPDPEIDLDEGIN